MNSLLHNPRRRVLLSAAGGLALSGVFLHRARAADPIDISMSGTANGSHVWFRPRGLLIMPGQAVRWINTDKGNVHTVTAYHPDNKKPLRIPDGAMSWNSGYLMPGESFTMVFKVPGVYDYFCIPHEQAGMVGRIVVGSVPAEQAYTSTDKQLPEHAVAGLPEVGLILQNTTVE